MINNKKKIIKVFEELLWIPEYLSKKVFSLNRISFTKEDIYQELCFTLWKSLLTYFTLAEKGKRPLMPFRKYVHLSCINKKVDLIRKTLTKTSINNMKMFSLETEVDVGIDVDYEVELNEDNTEKLEIIIDGIDILSFEEDVLKKMIFKDFILGFRIKELSFMYDVPQHTIKNWIYIMRKNIRNEFLKIYKGKNEVIENFFKEKTLYTYSSKEFNN